MARTTTEPTIAITRNPAWARETADDCYRWWVSSEELDREEGVDTLVEARSMARDWTEEYEANRREEQDEQDRDDAREALEALLDAGRSSEVLRVLRGL